MIVLGLLAAACGPEPLGDLGDASSDWIDEVVTTGDPSIATAPEGISLLPLETAAWFNAALIPPIGAEAGAVISQVYARGAGADRYVQAGPEEIAAALPGVQFPASIPEGSVAITSQLVFAPRSDQLDNQVTAAFGIWLVEPYSRSRSVGQVATLEVADVPAEARAVAAGAADVTCARFATQTRVLCSDMFLGGAPAWRLKSDSGSTLVWYRDVYRYQLFARPNIDESLLTEMAESMAPLSTLVTLSVPR
jgi:hypothetical protein